MSDERLEPTGLHAMFVKSASGWDIADQWNFQYYDAELAIDIGQFKAGSLVDTIALYFVDVENVVVQIYQRNGKKSGERFLTDTYEVPLAFSVHMGACVKLPEMPTDRVKSDSR